MNDDYGHDSGDWEGAPHSGSGSRYRDEVFSRRVPAGRRTYFFDVKATRSGEDFFIVITESKRVGEHRHEKHKIFVYKEDFTKFMKGLYEAMEDVRPSVYRTTSFMATLLLTFRLGTTTAGSLVEP